MKILYCLQHILGYVVVFITYLVITLLITIPVLLGVLLNGLWYFISVITIPLAILVTALIVSIKEIFKLNLNS